MRRLIRRLFVLCRKFRVEGAPIRIVGLATMAGIALGPALGCAVPRRFSASTRSSGDVVDPAAVAPKRSAEQQRDLNRRLVAAAFRGKAGEVQRLLADGAWGDARFGGSDGDRWVFTYGDGGGPPFGSEQWAPLHAVASARRDIDRVGITRLLLDAGAEPNPDDGYGATPLYMAARANHEAMALLLIERGADVNTSTQIYIDASEGTPLHAAVWNGNVTLVRALLAAGASVEGQDSYDFTPLHAAVGSAECTRLLIEAGADVNAGGGLGENITPLMAACKLGDGGEGYDPHGTNVEVVRLLVAAGADINARAEIRDPFEPDLITIETPLLNAARGPDVPALRLLVEAGAGVTVADHEGDTPLHLILVGVRDVGAVEDAAALLIRAGANRFAKNKAGETPLDFAPGVYSTDAAEKAADVNRLRALLAPPPPGVQN